MAWRSSGTSNDELVNNLKRFGVIQSDTVERAFRSVDRRYFVPQELLDMAHSDQPLRDGNIHISAPHIYGCIVEALDVAPSMSFLNIGSGTGYFSAIVGHILGPTGSSFGVEIHKDNVEHCLASMERWEAEHGGNNLPYTRFVHGNGLQINATEGEGAIGFNRIYVGASITNEQLIRVVGLLQVGGILVGPVGDELIKVVRVKKEAKKKNPARKRGILHQQEPPELSDEFSKEVISGVIFAPLLKRPSIPTVLKSRVWSTSVHTSYPDSFRTSCKELLLCSIAPTTQPAKRQEPINTASLLPKSIWLEIISYTHRGWFENPNSDVAALRCRVQMLESTVQQSQKDHHETKRKLRMAEREADRYRALAAQFQARLKEIGDLQSTAKSARTSYLPLRTGQRGRFADFFDSREDMTVDETVDETVEEEPNDESDSDGLSYSDDEEESTSLMDLSVTDADMHVQSARRVSIAETD